MTDKEKVQKFLKFKKVLLEDIDCWCNDFDKLKVELQGALIDIDLIEEGLD